MSSTQKKLIAEFADAEYAHAYMSGHTASTIAAQIYWTRKKRGWSQSQLAMRSGIAQTRISKIETGDFTSLTMSTLRRLAQALDVSLRIQFEPFSHAVHSVCQQTKDDLALSDRATSLQELQSTLQLTSELFGGKAVQISVNVVTAAPQLPSQNNGATVMTTTQMPPPIELAQRGVPA